MKLSPIGFRTNGVYYCILVVSSLLVLLNPRSSFGGVTSHHSYLMLVSFSSGLLTEVNETKLEFIDRLPYDGVALPVMGPYDEHPPAYDLLTAKVRIIKSHLKNKKIWPWVFVNRIVGNQNRKNPNAEKAYFREIAGIDLYNSCGALENFLAAVDQSLIIAREMGSPGIFLDPEFYNDYSMTYIEEVSRELKTEPWNVVNELRSLGARIADQINSLYPTATVWAAFTGLGDKRPILDASPSVRWRTITWMFDGVLSRARERGYAFRLVTGGEMFPGYCSISLEDLIQVEAQRDLMYMPYVIQFPNLVLGGTIAPWLDSKSRRGFFGKEKDANYRCRESGLETIEDFKPIINELLDHYSYVWIYAASDAGFVPFSEESNRIHSTIQSLRP